MDPPPSIAQDLDTELSQLIRQGQDDLAYLYDRAQAIERRRVLVQAIVSIIQAVRNRENRSLTEVFDSIAHAVQTAQAALHELDNPDSAARLGWVP